MERNKLGLSHEILTAFLSAKVGESHDKLKADSVGFVAENYGVDLSGYDVSVVENNESQIHLSLPFYAGLEEATAKAMADNDVNVAGGVEFWIAALIMTAIAVPVVAGTVGGVTGIVVAGSDK